MHFYTLISATLLAALSTTAAVADSLSKDGASSLISSVGARDAGKWASVPTDGASISLPVRGTDRTDRALALIDDTSLRSLLRNANASVIGEGDTDYVVTLDATNLTLPGADPDSPLPALIREVDLAADVTLAEPWSGTNAPQIEALSLTEAKLDWGDLQLDATGSATLNEAGLATGSFAVNVPDWERALALIPANSPISAARVTPVLAAQSDGPGLSFDVRLDDNRVSIMGIPITTLAPFTLD
ncbi:DUF2125 domain-containing protein [Aestuariibius insulae]|uniref:DUF2125 domain-containing protein n=1 Tax=Aestuariibius insulae TaxID=2058287 RepID=UPI00345E3E1D